MFAAAASLLVVAHPLRTHAINITPHDDHAPPKSASAAGPDAERASKENQGEIGRRIAAAAPGETITVEPGTYHERIVIDRDITLRGVGRPILDGGGVGDIVEIRASGATIEGFTLRNTGIDLDKENTAIRVLAPGVTVQDNVLDDVLFGIDLRGAPDSVIRRNRIGGKALDIARRGDGLRLWRSDRTIVEENSFHDGRDAVVWYSTDVVLRGNLASRCRYGLHLMYCDSVTIEQNRLEGNSVGLYIMYSSGIRVIGNSFRRNRGPSGYGIGLKEADRFLVEENLFTGNRVGVYLDGSPFSARGFGRFHRNAIAFNDVGMTFLPSVRGNELHENNFVDNLEQIVVAGRGSLDGNTFWRGDRGNFWSDYTGYDQNRDGVGDFVHESRTLFEGLLDREQNLRLFLHTPAQQAIEFVGRALPAILPEPKFIDEVPLMRPVALEFAALGDVGRTSRLHVAAATLLAVSAGILALALFDARSGRGAARGFRTTHGRGS